MLARICLFGFRFLFDRTGIAPVLVVDSVIDSESLQGTELQVWVATVEVGPTQLMPPKFYLIAHRLVLLKPLDIASELTSSWMGLVSIRRKVISGRDL